MKTNYGFIIRMVILCLFSFCHPQLSMSQSDTVFLRLQGILYGNIQWQQALDTLTWNDIPGATFNPYPLVPDQTRFYRAKVTSGSCDPFYSQVQVIQRTVFQCGDTLTDTRDGKHYPTVQIGPQCWMARNLDAGTMINNGTQLPANNGLIEKFCYNNNNMYCDTFGGLYDWNELMNYSTLERAQGICPNGWHVPSDGEWIALEMTLGMDSVTAHYANVWRGTDQGLQLTSGGSSGYNALCSGRAVPGGYFDVIHMYEYVYTSSISGSCAWRRCIRSGLGTVGRWNTFPQNYGLSVRCLKD